MFELWNEKQFRSAAYDALIEYKDALADELENAESKYTFEELRSVFDLYAKEMERRNVAAQVRNSKINALNDGSIASRIMGRYQERGNAEIDAEDPTASVEYRTAFMKFICKRERSDILKRSDQSTTTSDVLAMIPSPVVNTIIEKMEAHGMILPLVNRTSYPVGQTIPTSSVKPTASWVNEGAGSDRQKKSLGTSIVFSHYKLRCEISVSYEAHVMTLSAFEAKFIENVVEAMLTAVETAIISGNGSGKPKGILAETAPSGQALELTYNTGITYDTIVDAEAAIPQAYDAGAKWCMTKKTFFEFMKVKDDDNLPIAAIHQGLDGRPQYHLYGRPVVVCGDYMSNFTKTPTEDTVFAFLFNFKDYVLNNNYDMGVSSKQDWETEDMLWKAVAAYDGKVIDKNSLVTLTIKAQAEE